MRSNHPVLDRFRDKDGLAGGVRRPFVLDRLLIKNGPAGKQP